MVKTWRRRTLSAGREGGPQNIPAKMGFNPSEDKVVGKGSLTKMISWKVQFHQLSLFDDRHGPYGRDLIKIVCPNRGKFFRL
jgi:hypothetical protein